MNIDAPTHNVTIPVSCGLVQAYDDPEAVVGVIQYHDCTLKATRQTRDRIKAQLDLDRMIRLYRGVPLCKLCGEPMEFEKACAAWLCNNWKCDHNR